MRSKAGVSKSCLSPDPVIGQPEPAAATNQQFDRHSKLCAPILLILYLVAWFYCFGDAIFGNAVFVFRDSAYWHMPVLEWTSQQWSSGNIPLWNDYQGLGLNWVGQGTTTVFYPLAWLLTVPAGSFHNRYAFLLGLHVILATANAYIGARQMKITSWGALLVAIAYSWSSPVLIQHSNWPFLISAAWMPLAIGSLWSWMSQPTLHRPALFLTTVAMTMIILGGDPQGVYLCCLMGLIAGAIFIWSAKKNRFSTFRRTSLRWLVMILLTIGCSAIQLWATAESANNSSRAIKSPTPNLYSTVANWAQSSNVSKASELNPATTTTLTSDQTQALQFSQTPWSVFSLLSPNLFGTWRDYNRRWEQSIPATDRPWNPNLYVGLIPAILCVASFFYWFPFRRRPELLDSDGTETKRKVLWLQCVVIFCGLASFGWYGAGWVMNELGWIDLKSSDIRPETGGIHWLLSQLLPGYANFRYPAKVWQFAGFGICCLAGTFWDAWRADHKRLANRILLPTTMAFLLLNTVAFAVVLHPAGWTYISGLLDNTLIDPWLGHLRVDLAIAEVQMSLFQSIVVGIIFWAFISQSCKETTRSKSSINANDIRNAASGLIIAIVLFDLVIANSWQLLKTDRQCLNPTNATKNLEQLWLKDSKIGSTEDIGSSRLFYSPEATEHFRLAEMNRKWGYGWIDRPVDKLAWQSMRSMRATWMPQMHLSAPISVINADCTLRPAYNQFLLEAVSKRCRQLPQDEGRQLWQKYLRSQGVHYQLLPSGKSGTQIESAIQTESISALLPSVWVTDRIRVADAPNKTPTALQNDIQQTWLRPLQDDSSDWNQQTVTVNRAPTSIQASKEFSKDSAANSMGEVIEYQLDARNKTAEIDLTRPALVCWNFGFDPGWHCYVSSTSPNNSTVKQSIETAVAVNRIHTGVWLPVGQHKLSWHYQPKWWTWGGPITLVSWMLLGIISFWNFRGTRQTE